MASRPARFRSAAEVLSHHMHERRTNSAALAARTGLPLGTVKSYVAGISAPQVGSDQYDALARGIPGAVLDQYWQRVEAARECLETDPFPSLRSLVDRGRTTEADYLLSMAMDTEVAEQQPMQYAELATLLALRCIQGRDQHRGTFWLGEALEVCASGRLQRADIARLTESWGSALQSMYRYQDAALVVNTGLAAHPTDPGLWRRLGHISWYSMDLVAACGQFTAAEGFGAPRARVCHGRGQVLAELGEWERARGDLLVAIGNPISPLSLGYVYSAYYFVLAMTGDSEAAKYEELAVRAAPRNAWHFYRKALIEVDSGADARRSLKNAVRYDTPSLEPNRLRKAKKLLKTLGAE